MAGSPPTSSPHEDMWWGAPSPKSRQPHSSNTEPADGPHELEETGARDMASDGPQPTSKSHQKASGSHWGLMTQTRPTALSELHALKQSRRHSANVAEQVHPCLGRRRLARAAGSCSRGPRPPHSSVQGHLHPIALGLGHLCNLTVLRWRDFETNMKG